MSYISPYFKDVTLLPCKTQKDRPGPRWGSSRRSPRLPSRLERGHPSPYPTPLGTDPRWALAMRPPEFQPDLRLCASTSRPSWTGFTSCQYDSALHLSWPLSFTKLWMTCLRSTWPMTTSLSLLPVADDFDRPVASLGEGSDRPGWHPPRGWQPNEKEKFCGWIYKEQWTNEVEQVKNDRGDTLQRGDTRVKSKKWQWLAKKVVRLSLSRKRWGWHCRTDRSSVFFFRKK